MTTFVDPAPLEQAEIPKHEPSAISAPSLFARNQRQCPSYASGRTWLGKDVQAGECSNERGSIGQDFMATRETRETRAKSVGNGSSITVAFREKGLYSPYTQHPRP